MTEGVAEPNIETFWNEHALNVRESNFDVWLSSVQNAMKRGESCVQNGVLVPSRSRRNVIPTRGFRNECPLCRSNFIMSNDGSPRVGVEVQLEGKEDNSTTVANNARWVSRN